VAKPERITFRLLVAALLAATVVATGTVVFLSKGLPDQAGKTLQYPATGFNFVFGSGHPAGQRMLVDEFADGYALLTSGPVSIQADAQRVLVYTWLPPKMPQEAAFFWRRSDDAQNVLRTELTVAGMGLIDLSGESGWRGEITEFGFLMAGDNGEAVEIGDTLLEPDNLTIRLRLMWNAWTSFEKWTQKSINFLYGGDKHQVVALPILVVAWLLSTLLLLWMFSRFGKNLHSTRFLMIAGMLFLLAWVLLDIRWTANNLKQIRLSIESNWQTDEQQRSGNDLDGEIFKFVQRLKSDVLDNQTARILIIGDGNAIDYYLQRTKYHLLPHSASVAGRFYKKLAPESLNYVIFFGQPGGINGIPGWNSSWRRALIEVDRSDWGMVYRIRQP